MTSAEDFHLISWQNFGLLSAVVVGVLIPVGLRWSWKRELEEVGAEEDEVRLAGGPAPGQGKGKKGPNPQRGAIMLLDSDDEDQVEYVSEERARQGWWQAIKDRKLKQREREEDAALAALDRGKGRGVYNRRAPGSCPGDLVPRNAPSSLYFADSRWTWECIFLCGGWDGACAVSAVPLRLSPVAPVDCGWDPDDPKAPAAAIAGAPPVPVQSHPHPHPSSANAKRQTTTSREAPSLVGCGGCTRHVHDAGERKSRQGILGTIVIINSLLMRTTLQCDSKHPNCGACESAGVECKQEDRHRQTLQPRGHLEHLEAQLAKCTALLARLVPAFSLDHLDRHLEDNGVVWPPTPAHSAQPPYEAHTSYESSGGVFTSPPPPPSFVAPKPPATVSSSSDGSPFSAPPTRGMEDIKGSDPNNLDLSSTRGLSKSFGVARVITKNLPTETSPEAREDLAVEGYISGQLPDSSAHPSSTRANGSTRASCAPPSLAPRLSPPSRSGFPTTRHVRSRLSMSTFAISKCPALSLSAASLSPACALSTASWRRAPISYQEAIEGEVPPEDERSHNFASYLSTVHDDPGFLCSVYLVFALGTLSETNHLMHDNPEAPVPTDWPSHVLFFNLALRIKPDLRVTISSLQALILLHWYLYTELLSAMDALSGVSSATPSGWVSNSDCTMTPPSNRASPPKKPISANASGPWPSSTTAAPPSFSAMFSDYIHDCSPIVVIQGDIITSLYRPGKLDAYTLMRHATRINNRFIKYRKELPQPGYQWYFEGTDDWPLEEKINLVDRMSDDHGMTVLKYYISRLMLLRTMFNATQLHMNIRQQALKDGKVSPGFLPAFKLTTDNDSGSGRHIPQCPRAPPDTSPAHPTSPFSSPHPIHVAAMSSSTPKSPTASTSRAPSPGTTSKSRSPSCPTPLALAAQRPARLAPAHLGPRRAPLWCRFHAQPRPDSSADAHERDSVAVWRGRVAADSTRGKHPAVGPVGSAVVSRRRDMEYEIRGGLGRGKRYPYDPTASASASASAPDHSPMQTHETDRSSEQMAYEPAETKNTSGPNLNRTLPRTRNPPTRPQPLHPPLHLHPHQPLPRQTQTSTIPPSSPATRATSTIPRPRRSTRPSRRTRSRTGWLESSAPFAWLGVYSPVTSPDAIPEVLARLRNEPPEGHVDLYQSSAYFVEEQYDREPYDQMGFSGPTVVPSVGVAPPMAYSQHQAQTQAQAQVQVQAQAQHQGRRWNVRQ
ncbi:Fungal specific transcription factor domain [Rhizoctonia solani]|uniref:Fungal specific transcription factor domain n=1 Tax=Rhizoctonia solani TaxID=456999 RepID=A0A8H7I951_9AGAM|nr:Fungal specific transcription factor domain [Rhizoctonia solani]